MTSQCNTRDLIFEPPTIWFSGLSSFWSAVDQDCVMQSWGQFHQHFIISFFAENFKNFFSYTVLGSNAPKPNNLHDGALVTT